MKKGTKLILAALVMLVAANGANAQATGTATATATIVKPISITKTADMNFGNLIADPLLSGSVTLSPTGTRSQSNGVSLPASAGTVTAAAFTVDGEANYAYSILLPTSHTIFNGSNQMVLDNFLSAPSLNGMLDGVGTQSLTVGARLNVDNAQSTGVYTSSTGFDVTVNYN